MADQILIIGLGQFGMALARALCEKGAEVIAADYKKLLVDEASLFVTEAVVLDATSEAEVARLEPAKRDSCVCAIGDESREASIICTAILKQMGAPRIVARAGDLIHKRILLLVGAHQVVNPEEEFGKRFANQILYRHVIADASIGEDLHLTEICVQPSMIGKTLIELALPKRFGIMIAAIRRGDDRKLMQPLPTEKLQNHDNLIIVSNESSIQRFVKGV